MSPASRVVHGVRRASQVAPAVLCGAYEHLGDGWGELMSWIDAHDSSEWRTELNRPLTSNLADGRQIPHRSQSGGCGKQ
jgi:hypothetical protein